MFVVQTRTGDNQPIVEIQIFWMDAFFKSIRTGAKIKEGIAMGRRGKIKYYYTIMVKKANNNGLSNDFIRQFNR